MHGEKLNTQTNLPTPDSSNVYDECLLPRNKLHIKVSAFSKSQKYVCLMEQKLIKSEIESRIFIIRGKQVMFDRDLARLYNVQTKVLNQTVKRNANRFSEQFMFQLSSDEFDNWKSQIVTSNSEKK